MAFSFIPPPKDPDGLIQYPWDSTHPGYYILPPFLLLNFNYDPNTMIYGVIICIAVFYLIFLSSYIFNSRKYQSIVLHFFWRVVIVITGLISTVFYMPFTRILLATVTLKCSPEQLANGEFQCFNDQGIFEAVLGYIVLIFFVALVFRLSRVGNYLSKIALYFWISWQYDGFDDELQPEHAFSIRDPGTLIQVAWLGVFLRFFFCVISVFFTNNQIVVAIANFILSALLCVITYTFPQYKDNGISAMRFGLVSVIVYTNLLYVVLAAIPLNIKSNDLWISSLIHLAFTPVAFILPVFILWLKLVNAQRANKLRLGDITGSSRLRGPSSFIWRGNKNNAPSTTNSKQILSNGQDVDKIIDTELLDIERNYREYIPNLNN